MDQEIRKLVAKAALDGWMEAARVHGSTVGSAMQAAARAVEAALRASSCSLAVGRNAGRKGRTVADLVGRAVLDGWSVAGLEAGATVGEAAEEAAHQLANLVETGKLVLLREEPIAA